MAVIRVAMTMLLLLCGTAAQSGNARILAEVAPALVAMADYWPSKLDKPAELVLHGFLQTRAFPKVRRLAPALAAKGYSVLAPTLTLGIQRRMQSLACGAVHTHSLEQDLEELAFWTRWLAGHAQRPPTLIGLSPSGIQVAALRQTEYWALPVDRAVLISLIDFGVSSETAQWRDPTAELEVAAAG